MCSESRCYSASGMLLRQSDALIARFWWRGRPDKNGTNRAVYNTIAKALYVWRRRGNTVDLSTVLQQVRKLADCF